MPDEYCWFKQYNEMRHLDYCFYLRLFANKPYELREEISKCPDDCIYKEMTIKKYNLGGLIE